MADWLMGVIGNLVASLIAVGAGLAWQHRRTPRWVRLIHDRIDMLDGTLDHPLVKPEEHVAGQEDPL